MSCASIALAPRPVTLPSPPAPGQDNPCERFPATPKQIASQGSIDPGSAEIKELSDDELIIRHRDSGSTEAFQELVRRYHGPLYRFLCGYLGDSTLAEDVLQNTLLKIHLKRNLYEQGRPVQPWLYKIATRQAIDARRRAGRFAAVSLDHSPRDVEAGDRCILDLLVNTVPGPLAALQTEERRQLVREEVASLPEPFRQVVTLAYFGGLTNSEIAGVMDTPLGTVKSRLHLAIGKLQENARVSLLMDAG